MAWAIEYADSAKKALARLDKTVARRITSFMADRVAARDDPRALGEALKGSRPGTYWRYRVGDHRIICDIQDDKLVVLVVGVGDRKDVYR